MTDITETLAPNSDQLDAIELIAGPRTFTISAVDVKPGAEQPVSVHFADFPRPWKPGKSMRRVLAACWGPDSSIWIGRRVELFFDPEVTFGKDKPGGTRIHAVSHITKTQKVPLLVSRGRSANYIVEPLAEPDPIDADTIIADMQAVDTLDGLNAIAADIRGRITSDDRDRVVAAYKARHAELGNEATP